MKILLAELVMTKVSAQWMPRLLARFMRSSYHPRVYPDLAPSDFHHFPLTIKSLGGQHFYANF